MGGGGAMRAAAKVAGVGVVNCGPRGITAEHPVSTAARNAARPVSAISTSAVDDVQAINLHVVSPTSHGSWSGIDEWELAGGEEDAFSNAGCEQMPRLIFGGAPSLVEAQEATSELKDALEKVYLSSPKSTLRYGCSYVADQKGGYSEMLETESRITSEKNVSPVPPKHAMQAFRFFSESPAAQNVVASIVCDPNVWNAVSENPALKDFLHSQKTNAAFSDANLNADDFFGDSDPFNQKSLKSVDDSSDSGESGSGWFTDIMGSIKRTVIDMWSTLSDYFQNLFGGLGGPATYSVFADADGSARIGLTDRASNTWFFGLAVMAIVVVVLRRG